MKPLFCCNAHIPPVVAVAIIRIIQNRQVETNFEVLREYPSADVIVWIESIMLDNERQEPELGWWKAKLLGN